MLTYIDEIRAASARLLKEGTVEMVVGFRQGSQPMMNEPCTVRRPEDVDSLVWDSHCGINLANYLTNRKEKIAVIAKGCDSRNIVTHIIENKIQRDQLHIIGVPCKGMVDKRKVGQLVAGDIAEVGETDTEIQVQTAAGEVKTFAKAEVLQQNCAVCTHRNPVEYDELIAEKVEEQSVDRYTDVAAIEGMDLEQRQSYFENLFAPCIRCYACRNACPLCYCPTCFVDEAKPQWVGKGQEEVDVMTFHFLRAYHCAGRCTDCGSCERACPVGINMRVLTKKLEKDCVDNFGWEAGLSPEVRPALDTFKLDDPDKLIK
jgi:coenzyme F420-reducing hydrogenase beta subunit